MRTHVVVVTVKDLVEFLAQDGRDPNGKDYEFHAAVVLARFLSKQLGGKSMRVAFPARREKAREVVARFADVPVALVTGSSRVEADQMLRALGLEGAFRCTVTAEDVPRSKPAPDGYLMAIRTLGVEPGECVVVEDSAAGIAAGRAAGCAVIAVRAGNFHGQDQSGAHRVIETLEELTPSLAGEVAAAARAHYGGSGDPR